MLAYADRGKDKGDSSIFSFSWSFELTQSPSFQQQLRHSQAQVLTGDRFQRMKRAGANPASCAGLPKDLPLFGLSSPGLMPQETQCLSEWVFMCPQPLNRGSMWSWNKTILLKIIVSNHSLRSITLKFLEKQIFHSQIAHTLFLKE